MDAETASPSGTVTFLFTDIEGSTGLWEEHPVQMRSALERHDSILRSVIEERAGYVFSTSGDAFAAAFSRTRDAVAAAIESQRLLGQEPWPGAAVIRVRMGLHSGEAHERDGDYFGPAVNRAARVMSAGHGGQVLLSEATRHFVDDLEVVDLGKYRLKDIDGFEHLFQLGTGRFEALRAARPDAGNLRSFDTSMVGRKAQLEALCEAIDSSPMVTLVGPGGIGKTRLAVAAASRVGSRWSGDVWLVELAELAPGGSVAAAIASDLGVRLQPELGPVGSLVDALSNRDMLLVLDNCEHILDSAREVVRALRSAARSVSVLATSREPLGVVGERVWPVGPLGIDECVDLFVERATTADGSFRATDSDRVVIAEICRRLDGIALAVELAATRCRSMTVADIDRRLENRFRLLRSSSHSSERHDTMLATVRWSFDLLQPEAQVLFKRLCVFVGGFDLASAESVCADGDVIVEFDVIELVTDLVDRSMLTMDRSGDSARFSMLETFRQFAQDQLAAEDELDAWRDAHLTQIIAVAGVAQVDYESARCVEAVEFFQREWANIRAALQWALSKDDVASAEQLLLAVSQYAFWAVIDEVNLWATELAAHPQAGVITHAVGSAMAAMASDYERALELGELAVRDADGSDPAITRAYLGIHIAHQYSGRARESLLVMSDWTNFAERLDHEFELAVLGGIWQFHHATRNEDEAGLSWTLRSGEGNSRLRNPVAAAYNSTAEAYLHALAGRVEQAEARFRQASEWATEAHARYVTTMLPLIEAVLYKRRGDDLGHLNALVDGFYEMAAASQWFNAWVAAESIAQLRLKQQRHDLALPIYGYLKAQNLESPEQRHRSGRRQANELATTDPALQKLFDHGARMSRDDIRSFITTTSATSDQRHVTN